MRNLRMSARKRLLNRLNARGNIAPGSDLNMIDERDDMSHPQASAHLTAAEVERFSRRGLTPGELLAFSDV